MLQQINLPLNIHVMKEELHKCFDPVSEQILKKSDKVTLFYICILEKLETL